MDAKEYISSGIIEAYALGMLSQEECSEVEATIQKHPEVAQAVRKAETTMSNFTKAYSITPKPEWRNEIIVNTLAAGYESNTKAFTLKADEHASKPAKTSTSVSRNSLAIAASILLLVSVGFNVFQFTQLNAFDAALLDANMRITDLESQNNSIVANYQSLENDLEIFRNPTTTKFIMNPVEGRASNLRADVLWNAETEMTYVDVKNLPNPPSDKQYQLWALVDGKPVDMGVFNISSVNIGLQRMQKISSAGGFAVTLERAGGVSSPTMEQMFVCTPLEQT